MTIGASCGTAGDDDEDALFVGGLFAVEGTTASELTAGVFAVGVRSNDTRTSSIMSVHSSRLLREGLLSVRHFGCSPLSANIVV